MLMLVFILSDSSFVISRTMFSPRSAGHAAMGKGCSCSETGGKLSVLRCLSFTWEYFEALLLGFALCAVVVIRTFLGVGSQSMS